MNCRDCIRVVLVSPRNPLNIGAVARAMANFGFADLAVVAPYEAHWREAQSAVGAEDLLHAARVCATLAEAVADRTCVIGTGTLTYRKAEQPVVPLPALAPRIKPDLDNGGRIAIVFGPEKHGLTREDLALCHLFVEIPTDVRQPSMNLGQAVAVCLYELATRLIVADEALLPPSAKTLSTSAELDRLAEVVEDAMTGAGYSPHVMQTANRHDLRLLLRRLALSTRDTRRALGLFRRIAWRLNHIPAAGKAGSAKPK